MAGKRQKHPSALQGHRQRPALTILPPPVPVRPPALPNPPGDRQLSALTRRRWREMWQGWSAQQWDRNADLNALIRYAWDFDLWLQLEEAARAAVLVRGSKDQLRINPAMAELNNVSRRLDIAEESFAMTPRARMRLGVEMGDAAAGLQKAAGILADQSADLDQYAVPDGWEVAR